MRRVIDIFKMIWLVMWLIVLLPMFRFTCAVERAILYFDSGYFDPPRTH